MIIQFLCRKQKLLFLLIIILLIITCRKFWNKLKSEESSPNEEKFYSVPIENLLQATVQPEDGKNIFFVDTTRVVWRKKPRYFSARQACAIESAARTNSHMKVFLMFFSRFPFDDKIELTQNEKMFIEMLKTFPNVHVNYVNLTEFSIGSPMENFIKNDELKKSTFKSSHYSDVIRVMALWKYGGTYLDTDVIVKKKLDSIPGNYLCVDVANAANGAVMNFESNEDGKRLAEIFANDLVENFDGTVWGSNGPDMVTRVLVKLCGTNSTKEMVAMGNCDGFHVLPRNVCYPITGNLWEKLLSEDFREFAMEATKDSIVVHFWNNLSKNKTLSVNSDNAYVLLAKEFCPKVMSITGNFF